MAIRVAAPILDKLVFLLKWDIDPRLDKTEIDKLNAKISQEPRSRGGLIRVREFTMKDSYSLDRDEAGLDVQYRNHWAAYERIFRRAGLAFVVVGADTGGDR